MKEGDEVNIRTDYMGAYGIVDVVIIHQKCYAGR